MHSDRGDPESQGASRIRILGNMCIFPLMKLLQVR